MVNRASGKRRACATLHGSGKARRITANGNDTEVLLVGRYLSPFVRRVDVAALPGSLPAACALDPDRHGGDRAVQPDRAGAGDGPPTGESLNDSAAMLDHLDRRRSRARADAGLWRRASTGDVSAHDGRRRDRARHDGGRRATAPGRQADARPARPAPAFCPTGLRVARPELGGQTWFVGGRMLQPDITARWV